MKMCGEELKELEALIPQQRQIWPDSADAGIVILEEGERRNEKARVAIRRIVTTLIADGLTQEHTTWGNGPNKGTTWTFFIPIEIDGPDVCGTRINISWAHSEIKRRLPIEFLTIDMYAATRPLSSLEPA